MHLVNLGGGWGEVPSLADQESLNVGSHMGAYATKGQVACEFRLKPSRGVPTNTLMIQSGTLRPWQGLEAEAEAPGDGTSTMAGAQERKRHRPGVLGHPAGQTGVYWPVSQDFLLFTKAKTTDAYGTIGPSRITQFLPREFSGVTEVKFTTPK